MNKRKAVQQYRDNAPGARPLVEPSDEQVMIARVGVEHVRHPPAPTPESADPREALSQIELPDEPVGPSVAELIARGRITPFQAAHLSPDALAYLQRRRREDAKAIKREAYRRANRRRTILGDVLGYIAMAAAILLGIAVLAGWWLGVDSWPMWGGR